MENRIENYCVQKLQFGNRLQFKVQYNKEIKLGGTYGSCKVFSL